MEPHYEMVFLADRLGRGWRRHPGGANLRAAQAERGGAGALAPHGCPPGAHRRWVIPDGAISAPFGMGFPLHVWSPIKRRPIGIGLSLRFDFEVGQVLKAMSVSFVTS